MKLQYLGFLPVIVIYIWSHYRMIIFYRKYKSLNYFSHNVPSDDDPTVFVVAGIVLNIFIIIGGAIWGLS